MATKKLPPVPDLPTETVREIIARNAGGLDVVAERTGRSIHTVNSWTQGKIPRGADPFPAEVIVTGRARIYCLPECIEWADRWSPA